jgi:hypothetical protein
VLKRRGRLGSSEATWKKSLCNLFETLMRMIRGHVIKRNRYIQLGERQHTAGEALPQHGELYSVESLREKSTVLESRLIVVRETVRDISATKALHPFLILGGVSARPISVNILKMIPPRITLAE